MEQPKVRCGPMEHYIPNQNKKTSAQEQLCNELHKDIANYNTSLPFFNEEVVQTNSQNHSSEKPLPLSQDNEYAQKELELQRAQQKARIQQIEEYLRPSDQWQFSVCGQVESVQPKTTSSTEVKSVDDNKETKNRRLSFGCFK